MEKMESGRKAIMLALLSIKENHKTQITKKMPLQKVELWCLDL